MSNSENSNNKQQKNVGPFRWGAIIPFGVICTLFILYFSLFFDHNLKKAFEILGTKIVGAEVNIDKVETNFALASIKIKNIQMTDSDQPTHNSVSIGEIRFSMIWDALLRLKFVINEAAIDQLEFGKKRSSPGFVVPPPPPEPEDNKPSIIEQEANKIKDKAIKQTQAQYSENVLGDIASILGGSSSDVQLEKIQNKLASKEIADKLQQELQTKQKAWEERIKNLPQAKDFQSLGDRLSKVKTKDFKSPQELSDSLRELDSIFKEADSKYKLIQNASQDLNHELQTTQNEISQLETQVKSDIKDLEKHFKIPQIDAKSITLSLFKKYLDPYLSKINHYRSLANKYLPPNLLSKKSNSGKQGENTDEEFQPHPREKGITYEFGHPNGYPLFWLKKASISSQFSTPLNSSNIGTNESTSTSSNSSDDPNKIRGEILDITSHQKLINKPTTAILSGSIPSIGLSDFLLKASLDLRPSKSLTKFNLRAGSYSIDNKPLVESNDVNIVLNKSTGSLDLATEVQGFKDINFSLKNSFKNSKYEIKAREGAVQQILEGVFQNLPVIQVTANAQGTLPHVPFEIDSNLGTELQKGFERQIQAKINDARKKIEDYVNGQISEQKKKIESQINQLRTQIDKEIKKTQELADSQKKQVEAKSEQSKKDAENQAKKKLEQEGKKTLDDLKKKFGF